MDLPLPNPKYREHVLSPAESRQYINTHSIPFESLKQFIPDAKSYTDDNKSLKRSKDIDKGKSFFSIRFGRLWGAIHVVWYVSSIHIVQLRRRRDLLRINRKTW